MREITFHEVGMENFGPYIDPMILTFENDKLTLITGPNGIGKTMSLEALPFTLFGETCKKARGDDVVNTRTGKNCHTWVKFSIDNDNYLVDRYHKYTKLNNTVTISKNGEEPYKKGHREVVPEIERLICSKKSFTNTLMFGQKVKDFFTDLVDSDKKEIFRKILDLDIYTQWYKEADLDLKQIRSSLQNALESVGIESGILGDVEKQIEILTTQMNQYENDRQENIKNYTKSLEDSKRLLEKWNSEREKLNDLNDDIEKIIEQIEDVKQQISHHENEKETNVLKLMSSRDTKISEIKEAASQAKDKLQDELRSKYETYQSANTKEIQKIDDEINRLKESISKIQSSIAAIQAEKTHIQKDIDKLNDSLELGGSCPTCLRPMDDKCKNHLEEESMKLINSIQSLQTKEDKFSKDLGILHSKVDDEVSKKNQQAESFEYAVSEIRTEEQNKFSEINKKREETIVKIKQLADDEAEKIRADYVEYIETLKKKLQSLVDSKQELLKSNEKVEEIDHTIANLKQTISGYEFQLKLAMEDEYDQTQLNSYKSRKVEIENKLIDLNKKVEQLQKEEVISAFWKTAWSPSGIPSMLIDEAIPFMNEKVSEYLDKLTNGRYIVSFDTLAETKSGEFRDKISVNVLDTYTRANSRIQLSGGQTRLVDIATILTLGDLQSAIQDVSINILLFDEIFDSLDEENIGFVSKILSQLKLGKSIYLISHTQVEQLEADEILEFK